MWQLWWFCSCASQQFNTQYCGKIDCNQPPLWLQPICVTLPQIGSSNNLIPSHLYNLRIRGCTQHFCNFSKTDTSTSHLLHKVTCAGVELLSQAVFFHQSSHNYFSFCANNWVQHYECFWKEKVCTVIPICMIHCALLSMMAGLLPHPQVWPFTIDIKKGFNTFGRLIHAYIQAFRGWGVEGGSGIKDSRVSQEEEVEHRVVLAEVDQRPAEHPATHGQQAEPSCDQNHIPEQWSAAALRHLDETESLSVSRETSVGFDSCRGCVY